MPGLNSFGVLGRNFSFAVPLTIWLSVPVAFWEIPVAVSFTVALMAIFECSQV